MSESLSRPADGRIMCCICFNYFTIDGLAVDIHGQRWDMCVQCWEVEHSDD